MAVLSTILRGALHSPAALRSGSRSLNGIDSFPLHKDVDHPLTEGGAIMLMCQQLAGLYQSNRNHPDKTFPDSYYDRLVTLLDSCMHQVPTWGVTSAPTPLTEADKAQVTAVVRERLILEGLETARVDQAFMSEIKDAVKAEIYANLNAEALSNIEDWHAVYKYEFTEAMHDAFEAQYPGIHPGKGKAKEAPPTMHSQVVCEAQPRIREESTGLEEREPVKAQFGDAQVSLGFPGTEDNSKGARLKRNGERKYRLKRKGESKVVREARTTWYYTRSQVYRTS
ncbi:hypothetical protein EDB86DRAFT_3084637 [Lactarius hatsudake]|nr:hypothetical protein EDB86DRAFT_3084637 [Lactarius hatsudake]